MSLNAFESSVTASAMTAADTWSTPGLVPKPTPPLHAGLSPFVVQFGSGVGAGVVVALDVDRVLGRDGEPLRAAGRQVAAAAVHQLQRAPEEEGAVDARHVAIDRVVHRS